MSAFVYIAQCADGLYYVGTTRDTLERRIDGHNSGVFGGFTSSRLPVKLMFSQSFERITDAVAAERQLKGWSRAKKEALMRGDMQALVQLAKKKSAVLRQAQDEVR